MYKTTVCTIKYREGFEKKIESIEDPSPPGARWLLISSTCTGIIKNFESHIIHTWREKSPIEP